MTRKPLTFAFITLILALLLAACSTLSIGGTPDLMEMEEWDLLWISDSSGWGVAEVYAAYIEEDTGIPVNVYDYWDGGLSAGTILDILEGGSNFNAELDRIPERIPEMEVIVFYTNPEESVDADNPWDWNCGQSTLLKTYVNACEMDTFALYTQHLESIYQHIFDLHNGRPVIIRAYDAYNPTLARWEKDGTFDACQACWGNYNAAIHQAAAKFDIPVAKVYDAWNGSDHNQDPNDKGYTKDGIHPNELGAQVIAEELRKLGYDPVTP
ncbi:MAG: SGNH/GDSL hydrolase family protein [Anaerolineales bacterium]|jgi:hypothetical protein